MVGDDSMSSVKSKEVANKLFKIYGDLILCRIGSGEPRYNISKEKNKEKAKIAVYINEKFEIALVWDLEYRKRNNQIITSLSVSKKWEDFLQEKDRLYGIYKNMGKKNSNLYEKVLALSIDTLDKIATELQYYIKINIDDIECPEELKKSNERKDDLFLEYIRKRVSTTRFERDRKFRNQVLMEYGYKCAICRCSVKELLEAAHIQAVAAGGLDVVTNGICLCANHHIMYDQKLLKINFDDFTLEDIDECVKSMPWYDTFIKVYSGKILKPQLLSSYEEDDEDVKSH